MAIIYNGTELTSVKFGDTTLSAVYYCDTQAGTCTKVFPPEYCMSASIVNVNDIYSTYRNGGSGSFGTYCLAGQPTCLCVRCYGDVCDICGRIDNSVASAFIGRLCLDTSAFIGCTLETETVNIGAVYFITSRCCMCRCNTTCTQLYTVEGDGLLCDSGTTCTRTITNSVTCVDICANGERYSSGVTGSFQLTCCAFNNCFPNFIKNVCKIGLCTYPFIITASGIIGSCILVRIKDSSDNVILCGSYNPSQACVVLC